MRILIVGSDANAYTLAKKISSYQGVDIVFVAPGNKYISEFATSIDITATQVDDLAEFAKANEIGLTLVADEEAVKNSIADLFIAEGLNIFAPKLDASRIVINRSSSKKTLYKLRIQTPKFGIFDKENLAIEYARKSKYPLVIKNDIHQYGEKSQICSTFSKAKNAIEIFFENFNKKVVIEDFISSKNLSFYIITDGYTALPIGTVVSKRVDNAHGNKLASIAISPDYYISNDLESKIMSRVVYPLIDEISKHSSPYTGIIGIDLIVNNNSFQVVEFNSFFKPIHLQALLPLMKTNFTDLALAAAHGSLSDDYDVVEVDDNYSIVIELKGTIDLSDDSIDVAYSRESNTILSLTASTINNAKNLLIETLEDSILLNDEKSLNDIRSFIEGKL